MTPQNSPITVMGSLIRNRRLKNKLSQTILAKNICSQATISQIENNNISPNLTIITAICQRLDLSLEVVLKYSSRAVDRLSKVENDILLNQYKQAAQRLELIQEYQLDSGWDKGRYAFYLGIIELHLYCNYQKALQYFNNVTERPQHQCSLYYAWANIASRLACFKMGPKSIISGSIDQFDNSLTILKQLDFNAFSLPLLTRPYIDIMLLHGYARNYSAVISVGKHIQAQLIKRKSMCNLSTINLLMGRAILAQHDFKLASQHLNYAKAISSLCADKDTLHLVNKEIKQLNQKASLLSE